MLKSFDGIEAAIERLLEGSTLEHLRSRVQRHQNLAVFEVVEILAKFLEGIRQSPSVRESALAH